MVFVTGWACPGNRIESIIKPVKDRTSVDITVLDPNLIPTHNQPVVDPESTSPYAYKLNEQIRDITGRVIVVGWSMGGMIAQEHAACFPDTVDGLILIGSTPRFCRTDDFPCGKPGSLVRGMITGLSVAPRITMSRFFREVSHPLKLKRDKLQEYVEQTMLYDSGNLKSGLNYLLSADLRGLISEIDIPVLLIHGENDSIISYEASKWLDSHLIDSRLISYSKSGHDLPLQNPVDLSVDIAGFMNEIE